MSPRIHRILTNVARQTQKQMINQMKKNRHTNFRPLSALVSSIPSSSSASTLTSPISAILNCSISISVDSIVNSDDEEGR